MAYYVEFRPEALEDLEDLDNEHKGKTIEECREMLRDALHEMVLAYQQQGKEIPPGGALLEQLPVGIYKKLTVHS